MVVITLIILIVRVLDRYWMIMPSFSPGAISVSYSDVTLVIGLGGIWMSAFFCCLSKRLAFATHDPDWPKDEVVHHAQ